MSLIRNQLLEYTFKKIFVRGIVFSRQKAGGSSQLNKNA